MIFQGRCRCFRRSFCFPLGVRGFTDIGTEHRTHAVGCLDRKGFETVAVNLSSPPKGNDSAKFVVLRHTISLTGAPVVALETTKLLFNVSRAVCSRAQGGRSVWLNTQFHVQPRLMLGDILLPSIHPLGLVLNHKVNSSLPVCHLYFTLRPNNPCSF